MKLILGVLVVGSLDWESKDYGGAGREELTRHGRSQSAHRERWRQQRLRSDAGSEFMVCAPIRYGRLSSSRGNTFTMVFSPEYNQRLGIAKVIQCKELISSIDGLVSEAEELWVAESDERHRGEICTGWGCITLVTPDNFLDQADREDRQRLLDGWAARVSLERSYGELRFSAKDRVAAGGREVIERGRLRIPWPTLVDGGAIPFDLLLATATDPAIKTNGHYPTVEAIAAAWNKNDHVYYFRCNRLSGIQTADDGAIERLLMPAEIQ
jgi:hypothetical protein